MAVAQTDAKPRDAITGAAMHLFGKQGFTGTSMRDIANAVAVSYTHLTLPTNREV